MKFDLRSGYFRVHQCSRVSQGLRAARYIMILLRHLHGCSKMLPFFQEHRILSVDLRSLALTELARLLVVLVVVGATGTADVKCLRNRWEAEQLVLLKVLSDQLRLVPVKAILAIPAFTPTTAEYHPPGVTSLLLAVKALMLRAAKPNLCL